MPNTKRVKHLDVKSSDDKSVNVKPLGRTLKTISTNVVSNDLRPFKRVFKRVTFNTVSSEEKEAKVAKKVNIPRRDYQSRNGLFLSYDGKTPIPWSGDDYTYPIIVDDVTLSNINDVTAYMNEHYPYAILDTVSGAWDDPYERKAIVGDNPNLEIEFYVNDETTLAYPITLETGTALIDWGDGSSLEEVNTDYPTHTYKSKGKYNAVLSSSTVKHVGVELHVELSVTRHITSINNWGLTGATSACFPNSDNIRYINPKLSPTIISISYFLANSLVSLPEIEYLDVANVQDFSFAFFNNSEVDATFKHWNMSNAVNLTAMFKGAIRVNPNTKYWNVSNVVTMESMFEDTEVANPDVSNWNVSKVISVKNMFKNAYRARPKVDKWNTVSMENVSGFVEGAAHAKVDVTNWRVNKVKDFTNMTEGIARKSNHPERWEIREEAIGL